MFRKPRMNLFKPVVTEVAQHPNFKLVMQVARSRTENLSKHGLRISWIATANS